VKAGEIKLWLFSILSSHLSLATQSDVTSKNAEGSQPCRHVCESNANRKDAVYQQCLTYQSKELAVEVGLIQLKCLCQPLILSFASIDMLSDHKFSRKRAIAGILPYD